jgi:hypothetical protein
MPAARADTARGTGVTGRSATAIPMGATRAGRTRGNQALAGQI